jgi:hypothetical protein
MLIRKKQILAIYLFLTLITLLAFWQVGHSDFISYDDPKYVTENIHIRQGITIQAIGWAFTTVYASNWHPLTWMSHMLDVQLYLLMTASTLLTFRGPSPFPLNESDRVAFKIELTKRGGDFPPRPRDFRHTRKRVRQSVRRSRWLQPFKTKSSRILSCSFPIVFSFSGGVKILWRES